MSERKATDYMGVDLANTHLRGMKNNPTNNMQRLTERMYMRKLSELCMNRFQWEGLPNSVDVRFLEKVLYGNGLAVFYWEDSCDKYFTLRASSSGMWDMYDNPVQYFVNGNSMISRTVDASDCVPIWSNYMRIPDIDVVMLYSKKLANLDRSIEINSNNMRQSKIIKATESQRLSFINFNRQIQEGVSAVFTTENFDASQVEALDIGVDPRSLPALISAKRVLWNECLTLLGVDNNAGEDKKERLVSDEVDANSDEVLVHRATALKSRREAADKINRRFKMPDGTPLNVKVNFVNDAKINQPEKQQMELEDGE